MNIKNNLEKGEDWGSASHLPPSDTNPVEPLDVTIAIDPSLKGLPGSFADKNSAVGGTASDALPQPDDTAQETTSS